MWVGRGKEKGHLEKVGLDGTYEQNYYILDKLYLDYNECMSHAKFIYICLKNSKKPISFHDAIVQGKILINFLNIYLGFRLLHIIDGDQFMKKLN
jgi:hypothetical protein